MIYKCASCKTTKSFFDPAPTETAYCVTCQCQRLFSPGASAVSILRPPGRSTAFAHKSNDHSEAENHRSNRESMARSHTSLAPSSSVAIFRPCDYFKLCLEFMLSLEYSRRLFNRKQNRCYCENCYSASSKSFYIEGGSKYVIPRGWVRLGLYVDEAQAEAENIWKKWVVSYHGTSSQAAKSIIEHHLFLIPGDQCIDGNVIGIREGHIPKKFQVYMSASKLRLRRISDPRMDTSNVGL